MGATPARQFPMPGSYAMDNENIVAPQDPVPQAPQQQFVSLNSYSQGGNSAAPTTPVKVGTGGLRKFFGDSELGGIGQKKSGYTGPAPVKKPHTNPDGSPSNQYLIDSGY